MIQEPTDKIESEEEYKDTLAKIEELWKAPVGEMDTTKIMILRRRVEAYEAWKRVWLPE